MSFQQRDFRYCSTQTSNQTHCLTSKGFNYRPDPPPTHTHTFGKLLLQFIGDNSRPLSGKESARTKSATSDKSLTLSTCAFSWPVRRLVSKLRCEANSIRSKDAQKMHFGAARPGGHHSRLLASFLASKCHLYLVGDN